MESMGNESEQMTEKARSDQPTIYPGASRSPRSHLPPATFDQACGAQPLAAFTAKTMTRTFRNTTLACEG